MGIIGRLFLRRTINRLRRFMPTAAAEAWMARPHNRKFAAMFGFDVACETMIRDIQDERTYAEIERSVASLRELRSELAREPSPQLRVICS